MGHELEDYCKENAEDRNQSSSPAIDSRLPHRAFVHFHGDRPFHVPVDDVAKGPRSEVRHLPEF